MPGGGRGLMYGSMAGVRLVRRVLPFLGGGLGDAVRFVWSQWR